MEQIFLFTVIATLSGTTIVVLKVALPWMQGIKLTNKVADVWSQDVGEDNVRVFTERQED